MKYLLLVYNDEQAMLNLPKDKAGQMYAAYQAYSKALTDSGVLLGNSGLRPTSEATTVRLRDGKQSVVNGPFAETKERLGGYFLIEVPDLDEALAWAARCPSAEYGAVEVRPVWT